MPKHFLLRLRDRDMWRERRAEDGQKRGVKYKHIHMGTHAHTHTHTHTCEHRHMHTHRHTAIKLTFTHPVHPT